MMSSQAGSSGVDLAVKEESIDGRSYRVNLIALRKNSALERNMESKMLSKKSIGLLRTRLLRI
jgi:hypothetical protein